MLWIRTTVWRPCSRSVQSPFPHSHSYLFCRTPIYVCLTDVPFPNHKTLSSEARHNETSTLTSDITIPYYKRPRPFPSGSSRHLLVHLRQLDFQPQCYSGIRTSKWYLVPGYECSMPIGNLSYPRFYSIVHEIHEMMLAGVPHTAIHTHYLMPTFLYSRTWVIYILKKALKLNHHYLRLISTLE